ncbi:hypothetical protein [Nocardioides abyssi]|uniref:PH domain-containing protein n=1 Tax=Nocardioides abyssi TaxID=3058370 RepID=A0ABT8ET82_9ACTN|nr:hypothetical protein [Nocardioides abyssi]MDN4161304.1 hypothetical protein [Nocardioides abyssi]
MPDAAPGPTDHRFARAVVVRSAGLATVVLALLVLVATAVAALTDVPAGLVVAVAGVGLLALLGLTWWLRTVPVLHLDEEGYRVRAVRGVGTDRARWAEVQEAATASPRGIRCVVLRLLDGRTTTVPVDVLAVDGDELVRELQVRLRRGEGLRPF